MHHLLKRATLLILKVPEEIFHVILSEIIASSNTEYITVSFSMDFTVKKSFEGFFFFIITQFKEPFTPRYYKKYSKLFSFFPHLGMSIRTLRRR